MNEPSNDITANSSRYMYFWERVPSEECTSMYAHCAHGHSPRF
eukprot:COSAG04_NODE_9084_length_900_cov_1.573034_1_plen_42_part_10